MPPGEGVTSDKVIEQIRPKNPGERVRFVDSPHGKRVSVAEYAKSAEYKHNSAIVKSILKPGDEKQIPYQQRSYDERLLKIIPRDEADTDTEYELKVFQQLEGELREDPMSAKENPDSLFTFFYSSKSIESLSPADLLTTVEASRKLLAHTENTKHKEEVIEGLRAQFNTKERTSQLLTQVEERGSKKVAAGRYMPINEGGVRALEAEADMTSFMLLTDYLGDIEITELLPEIQRKAQNPSEEARVSAYNQQLSQLQQELSQAGKPVSFREITTLLKQKIAGATSTQDRFVYRQLYARTRREFYQKIEDALERRVSYSLEAATPFVRGMIDRLNEVTTTKEGITSLIDAYRGFGNTEVGRQAIVDRMKGSLPERMNNALFFDYGLKGAEYFKRMAKDPVDFRQDETTIVTEKKMAQGPYNGEPGIPASATRVPRLSVTPLPKTTPDDESDTPKPAPDKTGYGEATRPGELRPAPSIEPLPRRILPKPEPAPVVQPVEPPIIPQTDFVMGAAALQERRIQNVLQLTEDVFAHDLKKMPRPGYANIPLVGGIMWGLRHPVKMIWQNSLARNLFEQQNLRFTSDMIAIAKEASDKAVPVEVTTELINKALDEGRAMRGKQSIWRQMVWGASDYAKGILGVSQTSEQKLAKKWLRDELAKDSADRDDVVKNVVNRTLVEQNKLGDRFARKDSNMTLDQSNRLVLAQNAEETRPLETRHQLSQELKAQANQRIKEFINRYATGPLTDEQLVKEVDQYLLGDFKNALSADEKKEFDAPEVASNILSIAHKVTGRGEDGTVIDQGMWERYQAKPEGSQQTYWEKVNIDVLFGKGEWGGVRGRKEMGFMTERLARRLASRETFRGTGAVAGAVALAQDVITYGGGYAAGWGVAATAGMTSTLARSVGGVLGVTGVAVFKETGIGWSSRGIRGIKGRYIKEVEQAGREAARGKQSKSTERIRKEMEAALVNRVKASEVSQAIEQRLGQEQMTNQQARQLLVDLAGLDARLRLTDLSGSRDLNFKQQNYIQFTEGKENEEYDQLKGNLLNGVTRLMKYSADNPTFVTNGEQLYTGKRIEYGKANQQLGVFEKYSALAEAQLRVSSQDARMRQWFTRELQMTTTEVDGVMQNLRTIPSLNLNVSQQDSLQGKERTLRHLTLRRGLSTGVKTLLSAGASSVGVIGISEGSELVSEGWDKFSSDWNTVLQGRVPVDIVDGYPVVQMSPLQKGVLFAEKWWPEQFGLPKPPLRPVVIDGAHLNLPPSLTHNFTANALVDNRNGHIIDLTGVRLVDGDNHTLAAAATQDFNKDGIIDSRDDIIATNDINQRLAQENIAVTAGPDIVNNLRREIIVPSGSHEDFAVGHKTIIPDGSQWVKDPTSGKWDLVVTLRKDTVLVNDAQFDSTGRMVNWDRTIQNDAVISVNNTGHPPRIEPGSQTTVHEPSITKIGTEAAAEFEKYGMKVKGTEYYANNTSVSDINELRLYTHHEGNAVVLDMTKMKIGYQQGLYPESVNVQDVIKNDNAVFALTLPGHEEKVFVHAQGGQLRLDPTDNDPTHVVKFTNGREMQAGLFAKAVINEGALGKLPQGDIATELNNRQDVFKLGLDGKMGFIQAGQLVDHNGQVFQSFATIRGSGGVEITIPGKDIIKTGPPVNIPGEYLATIGLKDKITETYIEKIPSVSLSQPPLRIPNIDLPLIPLPIRQNIEKRGAEPTEDRTQSTTAHGGQPAPTGHHPPAGQGGHGNAHQPAGHGHGGHAAEPVRPQIENMSQQEQIQELETLREETRKARAEGKDPADVEQAPLYARMEQLENALVPLVKQEVVNASHEMQVLTEFSQRTTLESQTAYEQSLHEALQVLEGKDGIVELGDLPTIVIPDIHARRDFITGVLQFEVKSGPLKGQKVYDLLKAGKINVVCLGDGMHSEVPANWIPTSGEKYQLNPDRTLKRDAAGDLILTEYGILRKNAADQAKAADTTLVPLQVEALVDSHPEVVKYWNEHIYPEQERQIKVLMQEEMVRSLGLMKMIMDLKKEFPDTFHYIRGNHDDMKEVMKGYMKFANESADVKQWVIENFGQEFLDQWGRFEALLPLVVKNNRLVASHTLPTHVLTENAIKKRDKVAAIELTWSRSSVDDDILEQNMKNLGAPDAIWFIGHTNVTENNGMYSDHKGTRGGRVLRMNNPHAEIFAFLPTDRGFDPEQDVFKL